jgi:hypothetical protein
MFKRSSFCIMTPQSSSEYHGKHYLPQTDIPKLDKSPPLDRTLHIRQISQHIIHQLLIPFLAQPPHKALARQLLAEPIRREAVLGKAEVEQRRDGDGGRAELFLLFDEVGATDEANSASMPERREELQHGRGHRLRGRG